MFALYRHLRAGRFDVLHAFKQTSSIYGRIAGKLACVPKIFGGSRDQLPSKGCGGWLTGKLAGNGGQWIVNSNVVKNAVIRDFKSAPEDIHVVPNAVWLENYRSPLTCQQARENFDIPQDHFVVTIVACLRSEKNHPMFLRMAQRLKDTARPILFMVAGDGPMRDELENAAKELGVSNHVRFMGRCESVTDLYRATDIAVLTSSSEGLPNSIIEAGAAGLACVSSDNGGVSDIIVNGESGYIVPLDNDEAMADRVLSLLEDRELRSVMGGRARKIVSGKFSPNALADNLLKVYGTSFRAPE